MSDIEKKKAKWLIRISKKLKKHIQEKAIREGRSANNMLEIDLCKVYGFDVHREV